MNDTPQSVEIYLHVRVLISVVLGLGLTRLLLGISRFVQHPGKERIYPAHFVWVLTLIVMMMHFWWWEFGLITVQWRFEIYAFVLFYAFLFFLLASLLFPDDMEEYEGFEDYFISRRKWFFGLLALTFVTDFFDTWIKGQDHFSGLGPEYLVRLAAGILLSLVAAWTANRRFHLIFACAYLVYEVSWIVRIYDEIR